MRRAALLGLAALALHLAAPLLGAAPGPVAPVELCTAHGTVTLEAGAGGPQDPVPGFAHCELCTCQGMAAPSRASPPIPPSPFAARAAPPRAPLAPAAPATASRPRAPPPTS